MNAELVNLFNERLRGLEDSYTEDLKSTPLWQIDSMLPSDYKTKSLEEKTSFLMQKFRTSNPIYLLINDDLEQVVKSKTKSLKIFDVDPRYLEGKGMKESEIESFYKFLDLVKSQIA